MLQEFIESIISNLRVSLSQLSSILSLRVESWVIWLVVIAVVAFIIISIVWGIRAHHKPVSAGREDLVGRTAVVDTALNPQGLVLVEGERWSAVLDKGHAEPEEEVVISHVERLKLRVTKKGSTS